MINVNNLITVIMSLAPIFAGILIFSEATSANAVDHSPLLGKELVKNHELVAKIMSGRNYVLESDQQGIIKQVVDAGTKGDGSDQQENEVGVSEKYAPLEISSVELPANVQGQPAIDNLGTGLPMIAKNYGLTPDKLKDMLLHDDTLRIDSNNRIFYIDKAADQHTGLNTKGVSAAPSVSTPTNPPIPIASPTALANAFKAHSKLGASKTIYLDFVGYSASNTIWSASTIVAPPYDLTGDPAVFDDKERSNILNIWNRVAEDFVAFDVDVTTQAPASGALLRSSATDEIYGARIVITKTGTINCNCGGVSYVGLVATVNNAMFQPAWIFQQSLMNNEKYIADAISHEAGHTLGLYHDGQKTSTTVKPYYAGHGVGETGWAPIMGVGYYKNVTQWSGASYPGANNPQNDIATLASMGFKQRADDVGNTFAMAGILTNASIDMVANIQEFGVIEIASDIDMYEVDTIGGIVNLTASPATKGPNLDTQLTLYTDDGSVVASSAPETQLSSSIITTNLPAGKYFLAVSNSGHTLLGADYGYPGYASLGQYQITGTYNTR
jgi:Metallo-peptidase family M12